MSLLSTSTNNNYARYQVSNLAQLITISYRCEDAVQVFQTTTFRDPNLAVQRWSIGLGLEMVNIPKLILTITDHVVRQ